VVIRRPEARAEHRDALTIPNEWAAGGTTLCTSGQVHDANVIATVLAHGVGTVITMNVADFARFERYVSLVEL
jgi:hypothetical protein